VLDIVSLRGRIVLVAAVAFVLTFEGVNAAEYCRSWRPMLAAIDKSGVRGAALLQSLYRIEQARDCQSWLLLSARAHADLGEWSSAEADLKTALNTSAPVTYALLAKLQWRVAQRQTIESYRHQLISNAVTNADIALNRYKILEIEAPRWFSELALKLDRYTANADERYYRIALQESRVAYRGVDVLPSLNVQIHFDTDEYRLYNMTLSEKRARSVLREIRKYVPKAIVSAHGRGETELRHHGDIDDEIINRANRRVEIAVVRSNW